ncbi:MAG: ABC transporter permease subunit [Betaproteobacteria bacterium]|nr:ABC transporter permease subunit [Betaproteobacteria bacterium]
MPVRPVIFTTDALVYAMVLTTAIFAWWARRDENLSSAWRRVVRSRRGVIAGTFLGLFVTVGLLDSIHFRTVVESGRTSETTRYSADVVSLLDTIVTPLRTHVEKSFSAPLAAYGYTKERIERPDGSVTRGYPRLAFGGAHLADPGTQRWPDILRRALKGEVMAACVWILLVSVATLTVARGSRQSFAVSSRLLWSSTATRPWRSVLVAIACFLVVAGPMAVLSVAYHVFGTNKVGQDVLYLVLKSIRTGLVIGTVTTLVMLPFAIALGVAAGYFGGWVDDVIQYLYTTLNSIPGVLLIAAAVLMMQVYMDKHAEQFDTLALRADFRLLFLCIILGVTSWTGLCRLLRGEALKLREMEFVQAARALGVRPWRIILRHVVPNVMHIVIITTVLGFSGLVLAEAVLSYVGVGVDPSMNSFGTMINASRLEMARDPVVWWPLSAAFVFMLALVLSANVLADVVRDALDPKRAERPSGGQGDETGARA